LKKTGTLIFKKDNLKLGLIIGLIAPLLGLLVLYYLKFSYFSFGEFLEFLFREKRLITSLGSLCLLANVIFFTIYINTHRDHTAKGIFATTCVYGIGILLLKVLN
jgi:hypothetical protein